VLALLTVLMAGSAATAGEIVDVAEVRAAMQRGAILWDVRWKVKGRGNAAEQLGLKESTLRSRMKRLGITRP
jgi:transcriptional regulator with GAF, ATPase, and Fis domain